MDAIELARTLVDATPERRSTLLGEMDRAFAVEVAGALQEMCYEVWTADPKRVSAIAETLAAIAELTRDAEVRGYYQWVAAIEALVGGELEECISLIDASEDTFSEAGREHLAAKTQPSKLYALALLGRYDEAVECGRRALSVFIGHGDLYSAGKTEHNIGNLFWRREMYHESEPYLESAHRRFAEIDDQRQLAMVENCQAFVKTLQNDLREAETIYRCALRRATDNGLTVTEAEIETGLSNLYLFEGRYDLALKYLEGSREKYERLAMPDQSAICEMEIADIYLELNLLPEAVEFYRKVETRFAETGMQAELARSMLSRARALLRLQRGVEAAILLDHAEELYEKETNAVAAGSVKLVRAQMLFDAGDLDSSAKQAVFALSAFESGENIRLSLFARWLLAEIAGRQGFADKAVTELAETLAIAKEHSKEAEYLCRVSLGRLTEEEVQFELAVEIVESSRSGIASDELRMSYFSDRLLPYNEIIKIKLAQDQTREAFLWHERSRSRTLSDRQQQPAAAGAPDKKLVEIREELNWIHNQINRLARTGGDDRGRIESLRKLALIREHDYAEHRRRLSIRAGNVTEGLPLDLRQLQDHLAGSTLVEFAAIDGSISAFVISKDRIDVLHAYVVEAELDREIKQFLFQIRSGRMISHLTESNQAIVLERLQQHSKRIYDLLIAPLSGLVGTGKLVFAPAGLLHYLPFQALHDGTCYLIEKAGISYTPSAVVLLRCLERPATDHSSALLVAVPDAKAPLVEAEIDAVAVFFAKPTKLLGPDATIENLRHRIDGNGVIHLACHGKFRPDNPSFSSIEFFAEELTLNEARSLPLENCIITLSACESGLNEVVRGEELIGLTHAFFAAGSSSLVLSLWRVNDEATLRLMTDLYSELSSETGLAEALRVAQTKLIAQKLHPYFWAPFIISGRS